MWFGISMKTVSNLFTLSLLSATKYCFLQSLYCFIFVYSQDESINCLPEIKIGNAILGISDSSDADTLSDTSDSDNDDIPERDLVGEMKAICFATELLSLASFKVPTCCNRKACGGVVEANIKMIGTSACISWVITLYNGYTIMYVNSLTHIYSAFHISHCHVK